MDFLQVLQQSKDTEVQTGIIILHIITELILTFGALFHAMNNIIETTESQRHPVPPTDDGRCHVSNLQISPFSAWRRAIKQLPAKANDTPIDTR